MRIINIDGTKVNLKKMYSFLSHSSVSVIDEASKKHRMKILGEGRILLIDSIHVSMQKDSSCVMIKGSDSISLDFFFYIFLSYSTWEHEEKKRLVNLLLMISLDYH